MRLKKLTLHGFKSFADRTELDFNAGITGIVGPNGCGKSNVVDAVKWVLGEQSAKSLRGQQMADVVFSGSSNRKSMGMAEVSLEFSNDGELDQYGAEIVITRRLYRSGQSEYLINNKLARLRDIKELFLDTGIGLDAYSLIEQGKVDLLLQASNQDRRAVLEEAAGISKYKIRRKEAQRRLENVGQNLLRVSDVIGEVEKQLRRVKLQAGKARNYQTYIGQLQELKSRFYLGEYHNLMDRQGHLRVELDECHEQLRNKQSSHDVLEAQQSQLDLEITGLTNQISQVENKLTQIAGQIDSGRQTITLLTQRMAEQTDHLNGARHRLETQHWQLRQARSQQAGVETELQQVRSDQGQLEQKISQFQQVVYQQELKLTDLSQQLDTEKSNVIEMMRQASQYNNQISQLEAELQGYSRQRQALNQRRQQLEQEQQALQDQRLEQQQRLAEIDSQIASLQTELEQRQARHQALLGQADELGRTLSEHKEHRSALKSRHDLLVDMQNQMQGVQQGVKKLLERKESGDPALAGLKGLVAEAINTDMEHARIIEAALAGKDQYLVVEDSQFFEQNRQMLSELKGAVNIFALDMLGPVVNAQGFASEPGVVGVAAEVVRSDEPFDHLVRVLLGKTLIVDDLETAMRLRSRDNNSWRFVTRQGELIDSDGSVRVGAKGSGSGLIWRRSELEHLSAQLTGVDATIAELQQNLQQTNADQQAAQKALGETRSEFYQKQTQRVKDQAGLASIEQQQSKLAQQVADRGIGNGRVGRAGIVQHDATGTGSRRTCRDRVASAVGPAEAR